ncbi:MAG: hypothetical protein WCF67_05560 [Chitinophagaceae bacterium]
MQLHAGPAKHFEWFRKFFKKNIELFLVILQSELLLDVIVL